MTKLGDRCEIKFEFTKEKVAQFAEVVGDHNPVHLDEAFAASTPFNKTIVHGPFCASVVGTVLGTKLPGPGTILLGHDTRFLLPVFVGDEVTIEVEVTELRADKPIAKLATRCVRPDGQVSMQGQAVVKVPDQRVAGS